MTYKVQLFDVDGTLTHSEKDVQCNLTVYKTFSFWPLLSSLLARDPVHFEHEAAAWDKSMVTTPDSEKDLSSFKMMDRTVKELLYPYVTAEYMKEQAKQITHNFLRYNIVQLNAVKYLNDCLQQGIVCVLTTGSYLDGLIGFVSALAEAGHLAPNEYLLLNGAEVDWRKKSLIRANVGRYKTENLLTTLTKHNIHNYKIKAAFGDDPYINDSAILEMGLPNNAFVIKCKKNESLEFNPNFHHCSWAEFLLHHKQRVLA